MHPARTLAIAAAAMAIGSPAAAHHSFAMFDNGKDVVLKGTVKEFQWTNPHTWIQLNVMEGGKPVEYSLEGSSPNNLARRGWTRNSLKPGDQITVVIHPLRNGEHGGSYTKITLSNGSTLG